MALDPTRSDTARVVLPHAHTGRPPARSRVLPSEQVVRVEVRMPAHVAARLFERAQEQGSSVGLTAWQLLDAALAATGKEGEAME